MRLRGCGWLTPVALAGGVLSMSSSPNENLLSISLPCFPKCDVLFPCHMPENVSQSCQSSPLFWQMANSLSGMCLWTALGTIELQRRVMKHITS